MVRTLAACSGRQLDRPTHDQEASDHRSGPDAGAPTVARDPGLEPRDRDRGGVGGQTVAKGVGTSSIMSMIALKATTVTTVVAGLRS